ncbi:MAG TPA: di-trans,poly-cis-decaprenylcistransferase [Deltaproteobacteria bacterium]|nr:di-trans,poly-cis-decaprenylcistransferase [Deltaproteobacteria bacterium]
MIPGLEHVAIIMDGNGRWAKLRGLSRLNGHEQGAQAARRIVEAARERGITYLTLYAFSSENWNRPSSEVEGLFRLLERFIDTEIHRLKTSGVCIHTIGDMSRFPETLQNKITRTLQETSGNTEIHLSIALNYGGRDEIIRAIQRVGRLGVNVTTLDEQTFSDQLDTSFMPDPDLMIRTGGEWRISNFLLWQMAYTEIYFTDILWPDFDENALDEALTWFSGRQRRFGLTSEQIEGTTS